MYRQTWKTYRGMLFLLSDKRQMRVGISLVITGEAGLIDKAVLHGLDAKSDTSRGAALNTRFNIGDEKLLQHR